MGAHDDHIRLPPRRNEQLGHPRPIGRRQPALVVRHIINPRRVLRRFPLRLIVRQRHTGDSATRKIEQRRSVRLAQGRAGSRACEAGPIEPRKAIHEGLPAIIQHMVVCEHHPIDSCNPQDVQRTGAGAKVKGLCRRMPRGAPITDHTF